MPAALQRVVGNARLLRELLLRFAPKATSSLDAIESNLAAGSFEEAAQRVHALKGLAGNLAAGGAHDAASALERALREGRAWGTQLCALRAELEVVLGGLATLGGDEPSAPSAADDAAPAALRSRLAQLAELLELNDLDAEELVTELRQATAAAELDRLAAEVARLDFAAARATLRDYAARLDLSLADPGAAQ